MEIYYFVVQLFLAVIGYGFIGLLGWFVYSEVKRCK